MIPSILVADAGGTTFRFAHYYPRQGTLQHIHSLATPKNLTAFLNAIREAARIEPRPNYISLSFAGPVTAEGVVTKAPNIFGPSVSNYNLADAIREETSLPTVVINDMTAAGERERLFGKALGLSSFLIITVSTGVGSKVFQNSQVVPGQLGVNGELGHFAIDPLSNLRCGCGGFGHLESLASGEAARRIALEMAFKDPGWEASKLKAKLGDLAETELTNQMIVAAAQEGDPLAVSVIEKVCAPLALGINHIWAMSAVERVFIIGGFALGAGDLYLTKLREAVARVGLMGISDEEIETFTKQLIEFGTGDDDSGLLGAAAAAITKFNIY